VHKEEFEDCTSNVITYVRSGRRRVGHAACGEDKRNAYLILVGNPKARGPLGRPRRGGR